MTDFRDDFYTHKQKNGLNVKKDTELLNPLYSSLFSKT